jgi:hypothetical protein
MSKLNLVTVCTDEFPMNYPNKLHRQFQKLSKLNVSHYCITDRPSELSYGIEPITPFKKSQGWWNKINLYSNEMPSGKILYMDLDIVILKNFDTEILAMEKYNESMCCVTDATTWMGETFSSSLMYFESGIHAHIFDRFVKFEDQLVGRKGGDQVWAGPQFASVQYVDNDFPYLKKNLKFDLLEKHENTYIIPHLIDERIKLVDCGGKPKPHELDTVPYIYQNWHLV